MNPFARIICSLFLITSVSITSADNIILINPFKVPAGQLEESIKFWEVARDFLQKQPGYISTKLHQSLQDDSTFQLINVAEWESIETFKVATKKMQMYFQSEKIKTIEGLEGNPALYRLIKN